MANKVLHILIDSLVSILEFRHSHRVVHGGEVPPLRCWSHDGGNLGLKVKYVVSSLQRESLVRKKEWTAD